MGSSRTLYGVAVALLAPVFVALVDRLVEMDVLREKDLFLHGKELTAEEKAQSYEMQRQMFPKDQAPKAKKDADQFAWGKVPSKEAALDYDKNRDKRCGIPWSKSTKSIIFGRTSGDAGARHIRESKVRSNQVGSRRINL